MDITLYGIPNCDTVRKARAWLAERNIDYHFHDFRKAGVSPDLLSGWLRRVQWEALVNTRGTTWRGLTLAQQEAVVDADSAIALMAASPSVIKRPVLAADGDLYIGFSAGMYQQIFSGPAGVEQAV